jgi:hypothetical protein
MLIGCEVPDINYFLTLIKLYFFSQFYNYKKNKSLQMKAFIVNLNPDTDVLSIIHNQIQIDELHSEDIFMILSDLW